MYGRANASPWRRRSIGLGEVSWERENGRERPLRRAEDVTTSALQESRQRTCTDFLICPYFRLIFQRNPGCSRANRQIFDSRFVSGKQKALDFSTKSRAYVHSWRTEGDSNPRYAFDVYTLSRRAPSTARPPVLIAHVEAGQKHHYEICESAILAESGGPPQVAKEKGTHWASPLPCPALSWRQAPLARGTN